MILGFTRELQGDEYRAFLMSSMTKCTMGLLVVQFPLGPHGLTFLHWLRPFVTKTAEQSEWPGTQILGSASAVYYFSLSEDCVDLLASTGSSMFGWRSGLPEDLALLRQDG